MNYIPLNIKTHYELLSSLIKTEDLILYAKENNIKCLGITNTNMFNDIEFINLCYKNNIKPIIGVKFNIDNYNMLLYAKNYNGYVNLMNLVSINNIKCLTKDNLISYKSDLICVTDDYSNYSIYSEIYECIYLSYKTLEERKKALLVSDSIVYINENLYIKESDKEYLKYLYLIKDGKTIDNINEYEFNNHLDKDISEIDALSTINFSKLINIELPSFKFELPEYSTDSENLLKNLCNKGLNKRLNNNVTNIYRERLNKELDVIINMNFADYFLIVYDFILYAKKSGIVVGPGRGSAAGSLVSYTLGITEIDPIKYDLSFERFLNKDRVTLPDIDTDIEYLRRDEVVEYVKNKYGLERVANIITFGTLQPKQVIRDVGRVLKIDNTLIEKLIKLINDKDTFKEILKNSNFIKFIDVNSELKKLIKICIKLEGIKRHTSVHAAGVIISKYPLMNKVPLYKSNDLILTGYTMEYLEELGLLKMDFLALKNLTVMSTIVKNIEKEKNLYIDVNKIPLNDTLTLKVFNEVDTTGIFQFESEGMKSFLKLLKVKTFDDLVLAIAMYRPGSRDNIPELIKIREGKMKPSYIDSTMESILKSTYGIIVYQEQIIEILKRVGGFSYSKADIIRRAMSKKKEEVIKKYESEFIIGAKENGYSEKVSKDIYDLILKFANYGFNKSHSVAYSLVSYYLAFLKAHFRNYFMICLLNMVVSSSIKTKEYIDEAKVSGVNIKEVNIDISEYEYVIKDEVIYMPLSIIKNVGKEAIAVIMGEREKGIFLDYYDFIRRVYSSKVNTKVLESLILSGALDIFNINRKTMIENLKNMVSYAELCKSIDESLVLKPELVEYQEYTKSELINIQYDLYGFYVKDHPVSKYKRDNTCLLNNVSKYFDKYINVIAIVDNIKEVVTKNNEKMAFLTISDEYGKISLVLFPKLYIINNDIKKGDILKIYGKVEKRLSDLQLVGTKVEKI